MLLRLQSEQLKNGVNLRLYNDVTGKYVGQVNGLDANWNGEYIVEAANLYHELQRVGLLKNVIAALERAKQALDEKG